MAIRIIKLPDVGEGVAEAEVVEWHVKVGDAVLEDQVLAAVMTDKATVEVPSPVAGTVVALGADVGATLAVGAELVRLEVAGGADEPAAAEVAATPRQAAASPPTAAPAPVTDNVVVMRTATPAPAPPAARPAPPRAVPGVSLGPPRAAGE